MNPQETDTFETDMERRFAEKMRLYHSESVKAGMAKQVLAGRHVNRVPVGYRLVWHEGATAIEPDPVQAVHVHQAFLIAAKGNTSVRRLLKTMTGQGLKNPNGKPMSASGFHSMLTNPVYVGMVRIGSNVAKGMHMPIVSQVTFDIVQLSLKTSCRRRK